MMRFKVSQVFCKHEGKAAVFRSPHCAKNNSIGAPEGITNPPPPQERAIPPPEPHDMSALVPCRLAVSVHNLSQRVRDAFACLKKE